MKIIVISVTAYKEKDGILTALTEEGMKSFTVRGIQDPKSKNIYLNNSCTVADVELGTGKFKYPVIKSSVILESPLKKMSDIKYMGSIILLCEATKMLLQEEEQALMFKHLDAAIYALNHQDEYWMTDLIYLVNCFKVSGYELEVNHCVNCGSKKNIKTFSFSEGGFLCEDCINEDTEMFFDKELMLLLRDACNATDYAHGSEYCNEDNTLRLFAKLQEYIMDAYGISLNAFNILNK